MNEHRPDLAHLAQAEEVPGPPRIGGFVDASSGDHVAADAVGASADVNDVGIRVGESDRPDRAGLEVPVRHVAPGVAVVGGLPHAAPRRSHVEGTRLIGMPCHRGHAPTSGRADHAVREVRKQGGGVRGVGVRRRCLGLERSGAESGGGQ